MWVGSQSRTLGTASGPRSLRPLSQSQTTAACDTHTHTHVYSNTTHAVLTLVCCHAWIIKLTTQFTTTKWQWERWRRKLLNLKWLWSLTLCPGAVWRWGRPRLAAFGCQTPWHWSPWWHSCQQTPLFCFSVVAQSSVSQQKCFKLIGNMDPSSPK